MTDTTTSSRPAKRSRSTDAARNSDFVPYAVTQVRVFSLSVEKQAQVLRWLVGEQDRTGVLSHIKRYMHRCNGVGCFAVPATENDIDDFEEASCKACGRCHCTKHAGDLVAACSNQTCSESGDLACEHCIQQRCDECCEPLCTSCYSIGDRHDGEGGVGLCMSCMDK